MKGQTLGVWHNLNGLPREQLDDLAHRVEALGYTALWYPEAIGYEAFSLGAHLLSQTTTLKIGSGIANIYARDPLSTAQAHDTLNALYGGRFIMGLGVSHAPAVEGIRGHNYGKPVATMRAYLEAMAGTELLTPDVEPQVVIAALGPRMLALSAELSQGALPYSVTPEHTASARAILGPDPRSLALCATEDLPGIRCGHGAPGRFPRARPASATAQLPEQLAAAGFLGSRPRRRRQRAVP